MLTANAAGLLVLSCHQFQFQCHVYVGLINHGLSPDVRIHVSVRISVRTARVASVRVV